MPTPKEQRQAMSVKALPGHALAFMSVVPAPSQITWAYGGAAAKNERERTYMNSAKHIHRTAPCAPSRAQVIKTARAGCQTRSQTTCVTDTLRRTI
eukprot:10384863-Alexandrium_andersonii.AAC.1